MVKFSVIFYHEPLLALYNTHPKELPLSVAKHKSTLKGFDFNVVCEPGTSHLQNKTSKIHHLHDYTQQENGLNWVYCIR